jgi:hypothetical protein
MSGLFVRAADEVPTESQIRAGRLQAARRLHVWTEIEDDFVPRGRGLFVSASTDHVYTTVRGVVFQTGSATIIAERAPYYFTVSPDGGLTFYERQPQTWSEMVAKRARRRARV